MTAPSPARVFADLADDSPLSPADLARQDIVSSFLIARAKSHSPSDRIAFALDVALIESGARVSTDDDYPGWAEHIAALQAANHKARKEAAR